MGGMMAQAAGLRDAITAASADHDCPKGQIHVISDTAAPNSRHWLYVLDVCGVPRTYQDRASLLGGGFQFVEIPMHGSAPTRLVLPPRAPEEESDDNGSAPTGPEAGISDDAISDGASPNR
jgi:hypothetical protein